jgi:type IV pilus assembly protein PilC
MKYRYSARRKSGDLQVGFVEGASRDAAANILTSHELYVLSVEEVKPLSWYRSLTAFFSRVKRKELSIFTRQFATMLEAKISIHDCLNSLYYQTSNPELREAIFQVSEDIDAGLSLSQALEKQDYIFFDFYVNLVQSAEVTGQVEQAMGFLADYLEKEMILTGKVKNALVYPAFVIVLSCIVGAILIGIVFPQITPIFTEADFELPLVTKVFLALGTFVRDWWLGISIFFAAALAIVADYVRGDEGKAVVDDLALELPVLGGLLRKLYVARFAEIASVLVKGGIPIAQAIEIGGHTIGSPRYREVLHEIAEGVRRGELMSQAFGRYEKLFPPIVSQMVTVGEQTGKLDEMFVRIGVFYSREVDSLVSNLVELIQPAVMVVIGAMVGLVFAAVLLPLYNLIQVIH